MTPTLPSLDTLRLVGPELWLTLGMCAVLLVPLARRDSKSLPGWTALAGLVLALLGVVASFPGAGRPVFHDMLVVDPFSQFFKLLLLSCAILVLVQWRLGGRDQTHPHDIPDFLCLLLGAVFGMALMASASNLLMIFIAAEAASYPSYALAGFRKRRRLGSEASLKYVLFGAAASAIMLYGMSLIYGATGTLDLGRLAAAAVAPGGTSPLLAVGLLALLAGVAFKLSAVPMHFWCPDVFEGAPIEIAAFLSVASKGAAVCLLVRIAQSFGMAGGLPGLALGLAVVGAVTATWGNLVAFHQYNIKRLLAYSSIAHAGYMILAVSLIAAALTAKGAPRTDAIHQTVGAILFYLLVYLFMNLGAFTVAQQIARQAAASPAPRPGPESPDPPAAGEDIRNYAGLVHRSPLLAVLLIGFLLSLFGMPGLGGFAAKIYLAVAMLSAGGWFGYALIVILLVNTLLSLFLYLRPVYYMVFVPPPPDEDRSAPTPTPALALALLIICALGLLWTGLLPGSGAELTRDYAGLAQTAPPAPGAPRP